MSQRLPRDAPRQPLLLRDMPVECPSFACEGRRSHQVRQGRVFKRCSRCGKKFEARKCSCGSEAYSWTFVVDVAVAGAPREQRTKGGFATKAAAIETMNEL